MNSTVYLRDLHMPIEWTRFNPEDILPIRIVIRGKALEIFVPMKVLPKVQHQFYFTPFPSPMSNDPQIWFSTNGNDLQVLASLFAMWSNAFRLILREICTEVATLIAKIVRLLTRIQAPNINSIGFKTIYFGIKEAVGFDRDFPLLWGTIMSVLSNNMDEESMTFWRHERQSLLKGYTAADTRIFKPPRTRVSASMFSLRPGSASKDLIALHAAEVKTNLTFLPAPKTWSGLGRIPEFIPQNHASPYAAIQATDNRTPQHSRYEFVMQVRKRKQKTSAVNNQSTNKDITGHNTTGVLESQLMTRARVQNFATIDDRKSEHALIRIAWYNIARDLAFQKQKW